MDRPAVNGITLDHKVNWKQWILEKAKPNENGEITNKSAKKAYNDTSNLEAMCRDCNSGKNGPKGFFG